MKYGVHGGYQENWRKKYELRNMLFRFMVPCISDDNNE
jgi:hypothetical protein